MLNIKRKTGWTTLVIQVIKDPTLPMQTVWVQSLVRQLRYLLLHPKTKR